MARSDETDQRLGNGTATRTAGPSISQFQLKAKIGEGSFGTVWRAERDGMFVALKELNKSLDSKETQDELKSLESLKRLHHKSLLQTVNSWTETGRLYIEMELADGGSLKDRLKAYKAMGKVGIPEDELLKFFTETAQAIDYLHRQTPVMLHRDIKPGNVLLVKGCAKIADFGLLRQVTGDKSATRTQGGTLLYLAPESIANDMASVHTDLWSFAVTYVELRQGSLPFTGKSIGQIYDRIRWEPPELSDIFHPEEKKVILKALDKEPKSRHTSCYDFVFQLNRVVPWSPAEKIPVMETAAESAEVMHRPAILAVGQTAKNNPGPTKSDILLPNIDTGTATPSTDPRLGATEKNPLGSAPAQTLHKPEVRPNATMPARKSVGLPSPAVPGIYKPDAKVPTVRRRSRAPVLGALLLFTLAAGIAAAIWYVAHAGIEVEVRSLIKERQFAKALERTRSAPSFLKPPTAELSAEIERAWAADLKEPSEPDIDQLKTFLKDLKDFKEAFPDHEGIIKRRDAALVGLRRAIESNVDRLLLNRRKIPDAQGLIADNQVYLEDRGAALLTKVDNKQKAASALERADGKLRKNNFEGCLAELEAAKESFNNKLDLDDKNDLIARASDGMKSRDSADEQFVKELRAMAADPKKLPLVQKKLDALIKFRKGYPKTDWKPTTVELAREYDPSGGMRILLAAAWDALESGDIKKCRERIATVNEQLAQLPKAADFNPANYVKERSLLETLAGVYDLAPDQRSEGFKRLMEQVRDQGKMPVLAPKLWSFLAQLEKEKDFFAFQEIAALETAYTGLKPVDTPISAANSELLVHFLDRTESKIKKETWFPTKDERDQCLLWFTRIESPLNDYLKALKTECLLESGDKRKEIEQIALGPQTDWYGRYVNALVEEKKALNADQYAKAAGMILDVLKQKPKPGPERASRAVAVLRSAIKSARGGDSKDWHDKDNAKRAIPWLEMLLAQVNQNPSADEQETDDLIDLAFAAVTAEDNQALTKADKQLDSDRFGAAAKQKGHLGLAKAYDKKGKSDGMVVSQLEKALALKVLGKEAVRLEIDRMIDSLALHLNFTATTSREKSPEDAIATSALCERLVLKWRDAGLGDNLETAADMYAKAVENHAFAASKLKSPESRTAEKFLVYDQAVAKAPQPADGFLLPLIEWRLIYATTKARLDKVIPEGEVAVKWGEEKAVARKKHKEWWETKMCRALVALGTAKEDRTGIAIKDGTIPDNKAGLQELRTQTLAAAEHYKRATELKLFNPPWYPSYKLGMAYAICVVRVDSNKADTEVAITELTKAVDALEAIPEAQRPRGFLEPAKEWLKAVKDKSAGN
jgi:serine/threonine protein kinase